MWNNFLIVSMEKQERGRWIRGLCRGLLRQVWSLAEKNRTTSTDAATSSPSGCPGMGGGAVVNFMHMLQMFLTVF